MRSPHLRGIAAAWPVIGLLLIGLPAPVAGQQHGPKRGSLVIVGGGLQDPAIVKRFLELAGGADASIVVIPTAGEDDAYEGSWDGLKPFRDAGASKLAILHTRLRAEADTEAFADAVRRADGVWFTGGRQWRLADVYANTRVHRELWALLDRGGVIGGSSAGASIQASFLVRGDTKSNDIVMGDHQEGLGFLKRSAIDQHLLRRNRHFDLLAVVDAHPDLLGIGIDEDTAIVVRGDRFEVLGQGYVVIYDVSHQVEGGGRFFFLAPGDAYDMAAREASRPATERKPLERVIKKDWRANGRPPE